MESHKVLASENKAAKKKVSLVTKSHKTIEALKQVKNVRSSLHFVDPVTQHKGEQRVEP
jgi:hypothetical protein